MFLFRDIIHFQLSLELIATREIARSLIVPTSEYTKETLLNTSVILIWNGIDLSENELGLVRDTDHHDIIFIRDLALWEQIARDLDAPQTEGFLRSEPVNTCTGKVFSKQWGEISERDGEDEKWEL